MFLIMYIGFIYTLDMVSTALALATVNYPNLLLHKAGKHFTAHCYFELLVHLYLSLLVLLTRKTYLECLPLLQMWQAFLTWMDCLLIFEQTFSSDME